MNTEELKTINDLELFITGVTKVAFCILGNKQERYGASEQVFWDNCFHFPQ